MGNQLCKNEQFSQANRALGEVYELLSCQGVDSDDDEQQGEMKRERMRQYQAVKHMAAEHGSAHGRWDFGDAPGRPGPPGDGSSPARRVMPGESCVVTSESLALPGESCVVTSGMGAPLQYMDVDSSMNRTKPLDVTLSPQRPAGPPNLQPTKSFEVDKPYKIGDRVELWSTSQDKWCPGRVEKTEGEWVHVYYQGPGGQAMSKIMPNGHEQLRVEGEAWWQGQGSVASQTRGNSQGGSMHSPQKARAPPSPQTVSPQKPSGLALQQLPNSPAATRVYQVGDQLEIYSTSQQAWTQGTVDKAEGEWIHITYAGVGGQTMTKIMPNGHEQLRFPEVPKFEQLDNLTPVQSHHDLPPPPPPNRAYGIGDQIEIWSTSQSTWCQGSVTKVEGDWITVDYSGPGGRATKVMPNGHAHLRLLASTPALSSNLASNPYGPGFSPGFAI